jgi:uncharacterized membrane protein YdjX (TVP38/TMEM64 family)
MSRTTVNRLAMVGIFAALVYALYSYPVADQVVALVEWAQAHRVAGALLYIICVVLATVLFVGFSLGTAVSAIAITLGAQCAFLSGRLVARDWVARQVAGNRRLSAIEAGPHSALSSVADWSRATGLPDKWLAIRAWARSRQG